MLYSMKNRTLRWLGSCGTGLALTTPLFAQLSGSYTIDPSGTGTNNYTSFTSAISALSTSGVSGAVTFNVKQGTYTEQVTIPIRYGSFRIEQNHLPGGSDQHVGCDCNLQPHGDLRQLDGTPEWL